MFKVVSARFFHHQVPISPFVISKYLIRRYFNQYVNIMFSSYFYLANLSLH